MDDQKIHNLTNVLISSITAAYLKSATLNSYVFLIIYMGFKNLSE